MCILLMQGRNTRVQGSGAGIWIAAERLPQFQALWPDAGLEPAITLPLDLATQVWSRGAALVEIVRGRFEGLGPVSPGALAAPLGLEPDEIATTLAALQAEGFAMCGRFTAGANADEWCDRRLLARIHAYTVKRLRAEIEPVAPRDYLRFLFAWQHIGAEERMEGPHAVAAVVRQLEGFDAPAAAWESEILPARIVDYEPAWLDDECLSGRIAWARLKPRQGPALNGVGRGPAPVRTTPIALIARRNAPLWRALSAQTLPASSEAIELSASAQAVRDFIRDNGASFFEELAAGIGLLRSQIEEALSELVALGLVTSDSFGGLRALLVPSDKRKLNALGRRKHRTMAYGVEDAGRWALTQQTKTDADGKQASLAVIEHSARTLLLRYGVVFWRLLEREAGGLPPWRDLLRVYRRLEARGEIRGGRFVSGFSGEQFALPDAIGLLRETRRKKGSEDWVSLSAADPLNLVGILTPGSKLPALTGNRVLYRDGIPVATLAAGETLFHEKLEAAAEWQARKMLARGPFSPPSAACLTLAS
jgi:ATP-dependent helicase Lhr and Lhr-like helicase